VVPAEWVAESTSAHPIAPYYGYQWWLGGAPESPSDTFMARGFDGQYIYVFPSLDLVVVRNGHYDKYPGEPIGTPTLFSRLPSAGLVAGLGSVPPDSWDDGFFLTLLADSIAG
jgi:CubicO group peptidase (beta-lactamase class C family)